MTTLLNEINYRQVLEAMFGDLAIVDEKGIMIFVTEGFERQYDVKSEDVLGKSVDEIEEEKTFNPSVAKKVFETGEQVIMSHKNKKGNYVIGRQTAPKYLINKDVLGKTRQPLS